MSDYLLIINPTSAKGRGEKKAEEIKALFSSYSIDVDIAYTLSAGHAETLAYENAIAGYKNIIACGGDGCVNEVINGIMKSKMDVNMGIIPLGRGNDIAWNYGIKNSIEDSVKRIAEQRGKRVDVGIVKGGYYPEGRYFLNGNGFGFEPLVTFLAMDFKRINGMLSYIIAFIRIMINPPKPYSVEIKTEEKTRKVETQQISVSIGRRMGSTFMLAPNAEVDDGYFELMYTTHPFTRFSLILAVLRFLRGTHLKHKKDFEGFRTKSVEIISENKDVYSHVDGEIVSYGDGDHFKIDIVEKGVFVFC